METKIKAEWDRLREVMIHKPGIETTFGLLEPETFLYERHFIHKKALQEHDALENALIDEGIRVHRLKELIINKAKSDEEFRYRLCNNALNCIRFSGTKEDTINAWKRLEKSIENEQIDIEQIFNILLLNPTIRLDIERPEIICTEPLANLVFVRDQQAITDKGVVFGRMKYHQRRREVLLTKLALEAFGANIAYELKPDGTFEGGDFMPCKNFALIGLEPRTNREGVNQILRSKCLDFDEIVIVHQPSHPYLLEPDPQISMHLDTYFNVINENLVVGCKELLRNAKIEVYIKDSSRDEYDLYKKDTNLLDYLNEKKIKIINLSILEQLCYASNFLTIRKDFILAIDVRINAKYRLIGLKQKADENPSKYYELYNKAIEDYKKSKGILFPYKKELYDYGIDFVPLALPNITGGYGGIHCMTCALSRN